MFNFTLEQAKFSLSTSQSISFIIGHQRAIAATLKLIQDDMSECVLDDIISKAALNDAPLTPQEVANEIFKPSPHIHNHDDRRIAICDAVLETILEHGKVAKAA